MTQLLSLFIVLASFNALSCPNLKGTYSCFNDDSGEYEEIEMNQYIQDGVTIYEDLERGIIVPANSTWQEMQEGGLKGKVKARCSGKSLLMDYVLSKGPFKIKGTSSSTIINDGLETEIIAEVFGQRTIRKQFCERI